MAHQSTSNIKLLDQGHPRKAWLAINPHVTAVLVPLIFQWVSYCLALGTLVRTLLAKLTAYLGCDKWSPYGHFSHPIEGRVVQEKFADKLRRPSRTDQGWIVDAKGTDEPREGSFNPA